MSELTTDQIYKKITEKAILEEKIRVENILRKAHSDIGLGGTCVEVEIRSNSGKETVKTYSSDIIQAIAEARLEQVKNRVAEQAVNDFIKSVDTFKNHLATIESYQLLNGGEDQ